MKDAFGQFHPIVNFLYFVLMIGFTMFLMEPICLGISLGCAFAYSIYLKGYKALYFNLKYLLPTLLATALINPAFNHKGATILFYLKSGNPLTLESIIYGGVAATILVTSIIWFSCYNQIMTSDKFIYLFGKAIPALSLVLSMIFRFIPKFKEQLQSIIQAQKSLGKEYTNKSILKRAKQGMTILSIMVTWALEDAIITADSMKSRGYGLVGRTAFSIYKWEKKDKRTLIVLIGLGGYVWGGILQGELTFYYYPSIKEIGLSFYSLTLWLSYLGLGLLPLVINLWEDRKWKHIQSNI